MNRNVMAMALVAALFLTGRAPAVDMIWDGEDGEWTDFNWNGGMPPSAVVGRDDGTEGSEDNIIIGGANVLYDADGIGSDFRMLQGNTLTIGEGGSWTQLTLPTWSENRWTEMDLSELNLDNGSFNRIGEGPGDGGGALIFGSWKGDDNFDEIPPPQEINISLSNGGFFTNEGQMWFGSGEDHPDDFIVNVTINDGSLDLTGGNIIADDALPFAGDLVIFYGYDEGAGEPKAEDYNINFTGPGEIIVDSAGIAVPIQLDTGEWANTDAVEYEDLWDNGILQANGLDVSSGRNFNEFFTVTGVLGSDDYTLTSLIGTDPEAWPGDVNGDGKTDVADLNIIGINWQMEVASREDGDLTGDGFVNAADLNELGSNWQTMRPAWAAVPEPSSVTLLLAGLLAACGYFRKHRS